MKNINSKIKMLQTRIENSTNLTTRTNLFLKKVDLLKLQQKNKKKRANKK